MIRRIAARAGAALAGVALGAYLRAVVREAAAAGPVLASDWRRHHPRRAR